MGHPRAEFYLRSTSKRLALKKIQKIHQRVEEASLTIYTKRHAALRYSFIDMNFFLKIRNQVAVDESGGEGGHERKGAGGRETSAI